MSLKKIDDHYRGWQERAERMLVGIPGFHCPIVVAEHSQGKGRGMASGLKELGH